MWTSPIQLEQTFGSFHHIGTHHEPDLFGIEIELEGLNLTSAALNKLFNNYWAGVGDGSLRTLRPGDEAIEYRFRRPFDLETTFKALELLESELTKSGVKIYDSGRTSVHVHVNMMDEAMVTVYNFITLAIIFDELFVSQNGAHRIGNNFCFRFRDAEGSIIDMANSIETNGNLSQINPNNRYSSVNICSLFKFGTIEFRSMECTVNQNRLMSWVKTLQALKLAARKYTNPADIISNFSTLGVERFFLNTLGLQASAYTNVADKHRMLFDGLRLAQDFAYCSTWIPMKDSAEKTARSRLADVMRAAEEQDRRQRINNIISTTVDIGWNIPHQ